MVKLIDIRRDRWTIKEVPSETGKRISALALVLGDEHLPYLEVPDPKRLADMILDAATGGSGGAVEIGTEKISVERKSDAVRISCSGAHDLSVSEAKQLARDLIEPLAQTLTGTD